ncbi:universal stress protein [Robertkochia solimangrovi]|uniref:universal stress protein n=1 Tax=Robertkochia solimangrovi TaxID=2213046 RepID=UPI00117DE6C0|nr:universal stress protein [Robertkochia solimangrovi]TRZ46159.1 universal stress protein [Robertkochia solimangrovi]
MKKVIVATNFMPESINALHYAAGLAQEQNYELILFYLYNPSIHAINARISMSSMERLFSHNEEKLIALGKEIIEMYNVRLQTHFATGDFFEELELCINAFDADLVVMGMAQKSIEQDILGNTTTAAIKRLKVPLLAIPVTAKYQGIKNILFTVDVFRCLHKRALNRIREVAKDFGAVVEVFHVKEEIRKIQESRIGRELIEEEMNDVSYFYKNIESPEIVKAIREEIRESNSDLLIMIPLKYGFWDSLVHRSKTKIMAAGAKIPLLSLPAVRYMRETQIA